MALSGVCHLKRGVWEFLTADISTEIEAIAHLAYLRIALNSSTCLSA